jgi:hypothetical protein
MESWIQFYTVLHNKGFSSGKTFIVQHRSFWYNDRKQGAVDKEALTNKEILS